MDILVTRHGETEWNVLKNERYTGEGNIVHIIEEIKIELKNNCFYNKI